MQPDGPGGRPTVHILFDDLASGAALASQLEALGFAAQQRAPQPGSLCHLLIVAGKEVFARERTAELRRVGLKCPLLVIGDMQESWALLNAGADALLTPRASVRELAATVRALTRRGAAAAPADQMELDASALAGAQQLRLTPTEQRILEVLARRPGRVVTRELIVDTLYAGADAPRSSTVDVFVHGLRRKLDGGVSGMRIETVRGAGFRLAVA